MLTGQRVKWATEGNFLEGRVVCWRSAGKDGVSSWFALVETTTGLFVEVSADKLVVTERSA